METLSAWGAYTGSVTEWLEDLAKAGKIDGTDTVWQGPDGSYGVGEPTLEQEDDQDTLEMSDAGTVQSWLSEVQY